MQSDARFPALPRSAGRYDPSLFVDGAVAPTAGTYSFSLERAEARQDWARLVGFIGSSSKLEAARVVVAHNWVKVGTITKDFNLIEVMTLTTAPTEGLAEGAAPITFLIEPNRLLKLAQTGWADVPLRFSLDAAGWTLTAYEDEGAVEISVYMQNGFERTETPALVKAIDPDLFAAALKFSTLFATQDHVQSSLHGAELRDGEIVAGRHGVISIFTAPALSGLEIPLGVRILPRLARGGPES
ncbi:MAG: hypothetical protein ACJ8AW_21780 [Rhodopila sp.]